MTFCKFFTVLFLLNIGFLCLIYAAFKSQQLVCGVRSENLCTLIYRKSCPITCQDGILPGEGGGEGGGRVTALHILLLGAAMERFVSTTD